jgi:hypothetical protein
METIEQEAGRRLRAFVADWSAPERAMVERLLAGAPDVRPPAIERRSHERERLRRDLAA